MKQIIATLLVLISFAVTCTAADHSPRLYYNRFHKELNSFQVRCMDYYISNLTDADAKTTESNLEKVVLQLRRSRNHIKAAPVYKGDNDLRQGYLAGLDSLLSIFENDFAKVHHLKRYKDLSYKQLLAYQDALERAEANVQKTEAKLYSLEFSFAQAYSLSLKHNSLRDEQYKEYQAVSRHYGLLSRHFILVDQLVEHCITPPEEYQNQNLDTFDLGARLSALTNQVDLSLEAIKNEVTPDGVDGSLQSKMIDYLKFTRKGSKHELKQALESLETLNYFTNDFKNAQVDLTFFSEDYRSEKRDFKNKRKDWLRSSLSELEIH